MATDNDESARDEKRREDQAVEKLEQAEEHRAEKGLESGQTPGDEAQEVDPAVQTWKKLADYVT